jgi:hypothetical protein
MMKKFQVVFLAGAMIMAAPMIAFSQMTEFPGYLEFNSMGGGARAAGMGGAFIGLAEGEYAYSWNPGALIFAEKRNIGIQFASASDNFTSPWLIWNEDLSVTSLQQIEVKREHLNLDFGGFAVPFSFMDKNWAVGGGYRNIADLKMEYSYTGIFGAPSSWTQSNGIDAISLALSGRVIEGVGIGITANSYIRGSEESIWAMQSLEWRDVDGNVIDTIDVIGNETSHYNGVNFDLGLAAAFGMFSGGLVIHTPFDLVQNNKMTTTFVQHPLPLGLVDRVKYTTSLPLGYSAGISIAPFDKFTLAADFDNRPMSKAEIAVNWEVADIADYTQDPDWEDLTQFRVGAEYIFDAGFADVPLRVGFRNIPSVDKEIVEDDSTGLHYGDQVTTNILTFGSGLHFEKGWVDFAYQFGSGSYDTHIVWSTFDENIERKRDYSRLLISAGMNF